LDIDKFNYLDIGELRRIILMMMNHDLTGESKAIMKFLSSNTHNNSSDNQSSLIRDHSMDLVKENRLILDYVAISFVLGNDFLPHLPHLKIKEGALNMVMECYKEVQEDIPNGFLVRADGLNYDYRFLLKFIKKLSDLENMTLRDHREQCEIRKSKFKNSQRYRMAEPYERALLEWEYIENKYPDELQLGEPDWKSRYYLHYLDDNNPTLINKMTKNYLDGLVWMLRYYQGDCPSWTWSYSYRVAPACSTLLNYLIDGGSNVLEDVKLTLGEPISGEEQLLMILPPQSYALMEEKYSRLMYELDSPLCGYYPTNFKIDMQGHRYRWECYPILPQIDPELVKKVVNILTRGY
jgi:5'-3' exonuclease